MNHPFQTLRAATSAFIRQHWPLALVLIFFVSVLFGIRQKSKAAVAPPYADALQYYCKSSFVWEDIKAGKFSNIMASPPAMRPPGTALLLYPLGFRQKVSSYLFRSQFAPFLIWMTSLLLVIWPLCQSLRHRVTASAVVCCMGTLPMFFQFELNPEGFPDYYAVQCWGMIDTLLASVGALAAALIIGSARTRSLWLASAGWFAAAFSILIKPAGILIMASVAGVFIVEIMAFACTVTSAGNPRRKLRLSTMAFTALALAIGGVIYSIVLWVCFQSPYLGKETRELFSAALAVSHQMYPMALFNQFLQFARSVVGWPIAIALLMAAGFISFKLLFDSRKTWRNPSLIRISGMLVLFMVSLCWWWLGPGAIPRYYFPFVTLLIVWMLPDIFRQLLMDASTRIVRCASIYLYSPPILLASLLFLARPPLMAQRTIGVNLSVGLSSEEMKAGLFLIDVAEKAGKSFKLYILDGIVTELPHFQDYIKWIHSKQRGMLLWPVRANEWTGDPGLKLDRILECDYILFEGDFPEPKSPLRRVVTNYRDEIYEFAVFVSGLSSGQGVVIRRFGRLSIVELQNHSLFEKAFRAWAQQIDWHTNFAARNGIEK